jgi:hypothetical protein
MSTDADLALEQRTSPPAKSDVPVAPRVIVWRDIRWTCVWGGIDSHGLSSREDWVNFALHPIAAFDLGERPLYDPLLGKIPTRDLTLTEPTLRGFMRASGCMQCAMGIGTFLHADSRLDLTHLHEALQRVRDLMQAVTGDEAERRPDGWREPP